MDLIKSRVRCELGRHPVLYNLFQNTIGRHPDTVVTSGTDLCIEAPPGCGNSFFFNGVHLSNPELRVAHHHHVPAQVLNALRLGVPTLTILRKPIDSVLSRLSSGTDPRFASSNLRYWISFWEKVRSLPDSVLMVKFETLVADPSGVVALINKQFWTTFAEQFPSDKEVFDAMDQRRLRKFGPSTGPSPIRPDPAKAKRKDALRPVVERNRLSPRALSLYDSLSQRTSEP